MYWIKIKDEKPIEGQELFYYFKYVGVHAGKYKRKELPYHFIKQRGVFMDVFYSKGGYLADDVTHWMPRKEGDPLPNKPEGE